MEIELGTCVKNLEKVVLFQDSLCLAACGNMDGQICNKGCMAQYATLPGMTLIKNSIVDNTLMDAVVINDGKTLTTLIYPHDNDQEKWSKEREKLITFGLSKSEIVIFLLVMAGKKNSCIKNELFISKATLKTHLNNIYKKLPDSYQQFKQRR